MFLKISSSLIFLFILSFSVNAQRTIGGETVPIINGRATYLPKPEYPPEAKEFCAGGKVEIEVLIGEDGNVIEAKAISGDELLRAVSVEAVKKAKFTTFNDMGLVRTRGIVVYNFDSLASKCIVVGIVNKKALQIPKPSVNLSPPKKEVIIGVQIIVDIDGKVTAARAVSGHPLIRAACEKAAREAKFSPTFHPPPIKITALLVYKFKTDGTIDTNIEKDDKDVIGTPINLVEPPPPFCNCRFGGKTPTVAVETKIDEQGNVAEAKALSGHPILRKICEKAALESNFLPTDTKAKITIIYHFEATDENSRDVKIESIEIKEVKIEE